jgi:2-keto-3-deoxy-L-rhamnonate aldolase RhmA
MELRERIQSGELLFGYCQTYDSPGIIENVGSSWDWIWVDAQHGELTIAGIAAQIRAADVVGVPAVVRVPELSSAFIGAALDNNAAGVMVPMVETVQQARDAVRAARFPPDGGRSFAGRRVCDLHRSAEYFQIAQKRTVVVLQLETALGVQNAPDIAEVPGVDVLFIGPGDLRLSMGIELGTPIDHPAMEKAVRRVVEAAASASIAVGTVAVSETDVRWFCGQGVRFIAAGVDEVALREDSQNRKSWLQSVKQAID